MACDRCANRNRLCAACIGTLPPQGHTYDPPGVTLEAHARLLWLHGSPGLLDGCGCARCDAAREWLCARFEVGT